MYSAERAHIDCVEKFEDFLNLKERALLDKYRSMRERGDEIFERVPFSIEAYEECGFVGEIGYVRDMVQAYRYIHNDEKVLAPFQPGFVEHLAHCPCCGSGMMSFSLDELNQNFDAAPNLENRRAFTVKSRPPFASFGLVKAMEQLTPGPLPSKVFTASFSSLRVHEALQQNGDVYLLTWLRLEIENLIRRQMEQHDASFLFSANFARLVGDTSVIDEMRALLWSESMEIPKSLRLEVKRAASCEPCRITMTLPKESRDRLIPNLFSALIRENQMDEVRDIVNGINLVHENAAAIVAETRGLLEAAIGLAGRSN